MRYIFLIASATLIMVCGNTSHAEIYRYIDKNGVIHFTNLPQNKSYKKIMSGKTKNNSRLKSRRPHKPSSSDYSHIVNNTSKKYNIEPSLVNAVIEVESNWNSKAISKKGAQGLMQLMPATAEEFNIINPFNPEENIEGGVQYLRYLMDKFNGDIALTLAAYNAGPKRIEKFKGIPPITETRKYVKRVLSIYNGSSVAEKNLSIYRILLKDGSVLYTNTPPPASEKTKFSSF